MSRKGYLIMHAGCPVLWCSKLQIKVFLSAIKTGYIALNQVMRDVINFMEPMNEISFILDIHITNP